MNRSRRAFGVVTIITIVLAFIAWQLRWFSGEPTYRGRTVTEWLDRLTLYEHRKTADGGEVHLRPGGAVARDPALHALLTIGPKGVPTLLKRLADRAEWPSDISASKRCRMWIKWKWNAVRGRRGDWPAFYEWSEPQKARKNAAAFVLLALGTNGGAGFTTYMEAYAAAPKFQSVYATGVAGPPVGSSSSMVTRSVINAFPDRRDEIRTAIFRGLEHTNAWCRIVAVECAREFLKEFLQHKDLVLKLIRDEDPVVQGATLGALMLAVQQPSFDSLMPPGETRAAAQAVADDPGNTERVRQMAETVVKLARQRISE